MDGPSSGAVIDLELDLPRLVQQFGRYACALSSRANCTSTRSPTSWPRAPDKRARRDLYSVHGQYLRTAAPRKLSVVSAARILGFAAIRA